MPNAIFGLSLRRSGTPLFRGVPHLVNCLLLLFISFGTCGAQTLSQYYHTSWTVRDGAPSNMWNIAQTSDGFLWIASDSGLYRFDGVTFYKFQAADGPELSPGPLQNLFAPPSGGLWICYQFGGADFIKNGKVKKYGVKEGLPAGTIISFAQDDEGVLWAATSHGLETFDGSKWSAVPAAISPFSYTIGIHTTPNGDLYVSNGKVLAVRRRGDHVFRPTTVPSSNADFSTDASGRVWLNGSNDLGEMTSSVDGTLVTHGSGLNLPVEQTRVARDGSLWFTTSGLGLRRIRAPLPPFGKPIPPSQIESFDEARGLSGDYTNRMVEDREGSFWVITTKGLDQFRPTTFVTAPLPTGAFGTSVVDSELGLLVGTQREGARAQPMMRVLDDRVIPLPGSPTNVSALYKDNKGSIWIGGVGKLSKLADGKFVDIPLPPDLLSIASPTVQALTLDRDGMLWLSAARQPPRSFDGHEWQTYKDLHDTPMSLLSDTSGRTWFGYVNNKLAVRVNGQVRVFGPTDGVDVGNVIVMQERGDHIWFGGTTGVEFFRNGHFHHLLLNGAELRGISGLIETAHGDLWLNQASGVAYVPASDVQASLLDSHHRSNVRLYDYLDGIQGIPSTLRPIPTLAESSNGLLYFTSLTAMVSLDPSHILRNDIAPTVVIDSLTADGRRYDSPTDLRLTSGLKNVEIMYSASSLLIPKRVRFRYKLDGYDKFWQEPNTRRQAFYPRLPPGSYTFHVLACNNDGVWSQVGASLHFYVPPTFFESRWFTFLWIGVLFGLIGVLYAFRLHQATGKLRMQLHERASERERIARDLHDTFFQSIQGLLLRFQVATTKLNETDPVRQMFEDTLKTSDKVMIEGRELVLDIRTSSIDTEELKQAFTSAGNEFQDFYPSTFHVYVSGRARRLHLECSEEIYRLGREALSNAFRHARADEISVDLHFGRQELRVCIRDNGVGIDPKFVFEGRRPGHWGLPGMKERAKKIGGFVDVRSQLNVGTHIELTVPASRAYQAFWSGFTQLKSTRRTDASDREG